MKAFVTPFSAIGHSYCRIFANWRRLIADASAGLASADYVGQIVTAFLNRTAIGISGVIVRPFTTEGVL